MLTVSSMAWMRALLIISNLFVIGLFGWVLFNSRRPLCIDSKIVEKIDIVTSEGPETVWACYLRKPVPFSPYISEMLPYIRERVRHIEEVTRVAGPFSRPVKIEIFFSKPWTFEVMDHSIYIGEKLFLSEGHLEKALLKAWYRERQPEAFAYSELAEEVITDFLLYLAKGEINLEDTFMGLKTKLGGSRWPQVLKSMQGYCDSPWKASEHYNVCIAGKSLHQFLDDTLMQSSLRPLMTAAFIESYKSLSFSQQNEFLLHLSEFISSPRRPPLNLIGALWESHPSSILMGQEILKEMQEYIFRSASTKSVPSYKLLVSYLTENLRQKGFQEASSEVYFDFIYESSVPVNTSSAVFKNLKEVAQARPEVQIAIVDKDHIWFLPSTYPMDITLFKEVKSHNRMVETCGHFDFGFVMKYEDKAEKLMAIENCGKTLPQNLEAYISNGSEGFARSNKDISFVQFHLPSLALKSDLIPSTENVVALIKSRDVNSPTLQALGWQELYWEKNIDAYRPKAAIEAIQWFRF